MSAQTKRAATRKGGGSSSSKTGHKKQVDFRGITLVFEEVPGNAGKTFGKVMSRMRRGDGLEGTALAYDLLEGIFGEEELDKIDPVLKGMNDPWQIELLNAALEAEGGEPGEG